MATRTPTIVAVTLNPAFDRTLQVPDLRIGSPMRGRLVSVQPAGKAVNVARMLGALGTPSILTGLVGDGDRVRFERSFENSLVHVEMFEGRGMTRENITLVDPKHGLETHVRDVGFTMTEENLAHIAKKLGILAGKRSYVLFAGSLPPGMDADAFADLLKACADKGAYVAVDSSGPGLQGARKAKGLWLVKPNRDELSELVGRPIASEEDILTAARPLAKRVDHVVVTLGAEGAYLFCREGAWRAHCTRSEDQNVIKTVGSGDALLAGFVHAHSAGKRPPECLRWGVACGTAATLQISTGQVNPYDVKACLEKVELVSVK